MITKKVLLAGCLAAVLSANGTTLAEAGFKGFESRVSPRASRASVVGQALRHKMAEIPGMCVSDESKKFIGWNEVSPLNPSFAPAKATDGEKMDSIVGHYLDGRLMSKQTFEYTDNGKPLVCTNYAAAPDGKGYLLDGYYAYEYDDLGRVITATKVSTSGSSMMIEYVYDSEAPVFSMQIAYLPDGTGDWVPYQMGEYQFDSNYNTVKEVFSLWVDGDWMPVMKNEATYNAVNYLTSYFPYVWDNAGSCWVGDKSGAYEGQRFEYTQNGDDAMQIDYTWENGDWLEYKHTVYTYNDAALLTMREELYWNREKQNWEGGDGYGEWGDKKYNSRSVNDYDEYGRIILNNFYRLKKTADYVNTYRTVYEYSDLEDGEVQTVTTEFNIASDGTATTGRREIVRNNRFGGETYYAILSANNEGGFNMKEEEVRHYMPGYHWYLGYESFRYDNGDKIAVSKEEFTYADDFNPESEYETPIEGRHWVRSKDGLVLKTLDCFTWGPRDVMIDYVSYDCLSGTPLRVYGWDVEYDFSADCSKIFMWPDSNKGAVFYENKNISSNEYYNPEYSQGSDEWNNSISSHFDYCYSSRSTSSVAALEMETAGEIVAYYDMMGRRISGPSEGICVAVYSNGASRKIVVGK